MKYRDKYSHRRVKTSRDKFGNIHPDPKSPWEKEERRRKKEENKKKRSFVKRMYNVDKHWVKTLTQDEMVSLYRSWKWNGEIRSTNSSNTWFGGGDADDGSYDSLENFIKGKKSEYGSVKEARDLKIEELFLD